MMKDTGSKENGNGGEEEEPEDEDDVKNKKVESTTPTSTLTPLPSNLEELRWSDPNSNLRDLGFKISPSGKLFHVVRTRSDQSLVFSQLGRSLIGGSSYS